MRNRQIFGLLLLGAVVGLGVYVVAPFVAPLAWAAIIAYATSPVHARMLRLCGKRPNFAAALATVLLVLVLVTPVVFLMIRLQSELSDAYRELSVRLANGDGSIALPGWVVRIPLIGPALEETLTALWSDPERRTALLQEWLEPWIRELGGILGKVGHSLLQLAMATVALFFFYRDGDFVVEQLHEGLRKIVGAAADRYFTAIGSTTRAVVFGLILTALAQGLLAGLGYAFVGVGTPILLGALTVATALIPFVGTVAVWAPVAVWLLLSGQIGPGLALLAWGVLVVSTADNFLRPLLISNVADIPLMIVLFGVMGGLLAFGFVGLFLGPLILAMLLAIWREWLAEDETPASAGAPEAG
jgi:predicted PurR-regulated permease PerM